MGIKSLFKHLLLTTAVLSIYACGGGGESSHKTETIIEVQKQQSTNLVFADQKLTDCVQALIDSEGYTLVEEIKQLICSGEGIEDIEGIQNLSSLETLNLSNNQIRDITPISKLGKLKQLDLQGNDLQLLSPITENQLLEQVDISDNDDVICSEQTKLQQSIGEENLTVNQPCVQGQQAETETKIFGDENLKNCIIETAKSLKIQYLEQIQQLKCVNYAIDDISGIEQLENLRELDLTQNNIRDITPLRGLSLLKKVLLGHNQISNIQALTTSTTSTTSKYIQELRLDNNRLTDIQAVETLTALRQIHLTNNEIRDLTPLQSLTELLELRISNNRIIDIQALADLPKLTSLWIQGNQIADLAPLQSLQHLEQLWLSNNWLTDLTPLQTQSKLKWLHIDGTEAADLQPLNKLTQLKWLQLDNTRVDDITAIYPLTKLDWLHLKGNNTIPCSQLVHMEEILTPEKIDRPETCSQPQEQTGNPISTIEFQDQALKECVYDAAREQGITNAEELTALSCPEADITDITGLTQFPGITSIDLTGNNYISCAQLEQLQDRVGEALIRSEQCNLPPMVAAQQEQTVTTGTQVDLNAEATDPNGDSLTYNWQQTAGQSVQLTNQSTATPNFIAPQGEDQTITFQLTVTDQYGLSATQTINVLVTGAILGSKDNPFLVTSYEDLKKVGTGIDGWNLDSHYLQTADIDATPSKTENPIPETEGEYYGFVPIGTEETPFTGGYNGGGFEIDGLTINRVGQNYVGLFGYGYDSNLVNINMVNANVIGIANVGIVGGFLGGEVVNVNNISSSGKVVGLTIVGGVFGIVYGETVEISYLSSNAEVNSGTVTGGLIGIARSDSNLTLNNSYYAGQIFCGDDIVGGLVGQILSENSFIANESYVVGSISSTDVTKDYYYIGGVFGNVSAPLLDVNDIYFEGDIAITTGLTYDVYYVGGLIGIVSDYYEATISNCYAKANLNVESLHASQIGGMIGYVNGDNIELSSNEFNGDIDLKVSVAGVTANIGGFIGIVYGNVDINNNYSHSNILINYFDEQNHYSQFIGGFLGYAVGSGKIEKSFATGSITLTLGDYVDREIGGFAGMSSGIDYDQVYATGNVVGKEAVGALIGTFKGNISNSYARGNVTGNSQVGGLVGQMQHSDGDDENPATYSSITNSYSTGQVLLQNEELEPVDFGGLVGASTSELNTVTNSFWDIETSGQEASAGGTPKTSEELKTTTTFTNAGWDFNETWMILSEGYTYPRLAWNTIEIESWTELSNMRNNMHANYVLTRDLLISDADYAELAGPDANEGKGWEPVGTDEKPFMGTFDGGGFIIDGLTINRLEEPFVGLYGKAIDSHFTRIEAVNLSVNGGIYVGSIIGFLTGQNENFSLSDITIYGDITANNGFVGGLAGSISGDDGGVFDNNSFIGNVSSNNNGYVGGLVGFMVGNKLLVSRSLFDGDIRGRMYVGGVVGFMDGIDAEINITNSNATVGITWDDEYSGQYIGGLVGEIGGDLVKISDSHSMINIMLDGAGTQFVGGIVGRVRDSLLNKLYNVHSEGKIRINGDGSHIAGIAGSVNGKLVSNNNHANVDIYVDGAGLYIGGFAGYFTGDVFQSYSNGSIEILDRGYCVGGFGGYAMGNFGESFSAGDLQIAVSEDTTIYIGGFTGRTDSGTFTDTYATGNVIAPDGKLVGGLIGQMSGDVNNSYSTGLISGEEYVGGLIGSGDGEITNSFWDIETSGQETSAGGTGLTTVEMQDQYTFESAGWDFYSVWGYNYGEYPFLLEQDDISLIEFESGQYNGTYAWDCGDGLSGSENITLDLTESYGVISGTADYLGGQTTIANGSFNELTGSVSFDLPASATNVLNSFAGTYTPDDPMAKIAGDTAWGDSPAGEGCQSSFGAAGTMSLY